MEYPKIETLYQRDLETHKVTNRVRRPEFDVVGRWLVTEKVDGTNIRIVLERPGAVEVQLDAEVESRLVGGKPTVTIKGRTDRAQIPPFLLEKLEELFPVSRFEGVFSDVVEVVLYGEGYGARIQKAGGDYREGVSFRLFDVLVRGERTWWLKWADVQDIARKLQIETVPVLGVDLSTSDAVTLATGDSLVAIDDRGLTFDDVIPHREGIVARTEPPLFDRRGHRVVWKLKARDL